MLKFGLYMSLISATHPETKNYTGHLFTTDFLNICKTYLKFEGHL